MCAIEAKYRPYLHEIVDEADLADRSLEAFRARVPAWTEADVAEDPDGTVVWNAVHSQIDMFASIELFLAAYGRVSLMLFPDRQAGPNGEARAKALRSALQIADDHPIGDRQLRNDWLHFDERLDRFLNTNGYLPVSQRFDRSGHLTAEQRRRILRLIDPHNELVYITGQKHSLRELQSHLREVSRRATDALKRRDT